MADSRERSRQLSEDVLDASPDVVVVVDSSGAITYVNDRVTDLLGYEPDDLLGEPVERLVPPDHRDAHVAERDAYLADPETRPMGANLDLSARCSDGTTLPVDVSLSPIPVGGDVGAVAVIRDVTGKRSLRRKYRTILEAVPDAVFVADAETGTLVEVNERAADLLGCDPADLVGEPQTALHPTGEEARYVALFEGHATGERTIVTQFPDGDDVFVETWDGERVPVEINAQTFELPDEERLLVAGAFRDISARRNREQALERLHAATQELMSATTVEAVATVASETATEVLGLPMNGIHLYDADDGALVPVAWSAASEAVFGDAPPSIPAGSGLAWEVFERGTPRFIEDVREESDTLNPETPFGSELLLPLGSHGVLLVSSRTPDDFDATDRGLAQVLAANVQAALDRVDREQDLRRQNDRLDEFTGIVGHDLRNPLNVAEGRLELARRDCDSEHLDHIQQAHERMADLIDDLLALARQGRTVGSTEPVALAPLVEDCWRTVDTGAATLETTTDRRVRADESRLRQLLENLIRNAVEHGGPDVTVTVGSLPGGFFVADDGPGIDDAADVFRAGYTTGDGGSGLGLSIVQQIAEAHGWSVDVAESETGGARFEVTDVDGA